MRRKVTVVGAGNTGRTVAQEVARRDYADVVLVDVNDRPIGVREKQRAHIEGVLHRAISIFIFDLAGERMLLQLTAT